MSVTKIWKSKYSAVMALLLGLGILAGTFTPAEATQRTFNTGSYILGADSCWQPNNDTNKPACPATTDPTNPLCTPTICDTNKNDESVFQLYGLLYALLDTGDQPDTCINNDGSTPQQKAMFGYCKQLKIYWIIDNTKTDPQTPDLTLNLASASAANPIVTIYNSTTKSNTGATQSVPYRGGPFVIDANDLTTAEFNAIKAKFPSVKLHKANIPFSGNVDKELIGKPPKIAVLSEGSSDILEDYIRAAGQFAWKGVVFQYLGARDIMAGCLQTPIPATCTARRPDIFTPFALIWAPHWEIENTWSGESSAPSAADQTSVVREIRTFLEGGNSGFFECASIGSLEGTSSSNNIGMSVAAGAGGYLVSKDSAAPRIDNNKGCYDKGTCSSGYLKFEAVPFWLTQCGGWNYKPTSGLVDSMRPVASYSYLTSQTTDNATTAADDRFVGTQMTRFIHDDPSKLNSAYTPSSDYYVYDYLLGGRINGAPGQGYVIFFPGHKYISCNNNTTYTDPPSRTFDLLFDTDLPTTGTVTIELKHEKCTHTSSTVTTCPTATYNLATKAGTKAGDSWATLSTEFATYDAGTNRLEGVIVTSAFTDAATTVSQLANTSTLRITDLYITFASNSGVIKLLNVVDMTQAGKRMSVCAPNLTYTTTPVRCTTTTTPTDYPQTALSFHFDQDVSSHSSTKSTINVQLNISGGTTVSASFNTKTNTFTAAATSGNVTIDMSQASYDAANFTLNNVLVMRGSTCGAITLTDIRVSSDIPSSPPVLRQVWNDTATEPLCSPNLPMPTGCSDVLPPGPITGITTEIRFNTALDTSSSVALTLDYSWTDIASGASGNGSLSATRTNASKPVVSDTYMTIDMSGTTYTSSSKYLSGIKIINRDSTKTISITKVTIGLNQTNNLLRYVDMTNTSTPTIVCWGSSCGGSNIVSGTPLIKSPTTAYVVKDKTNPPPAPPTWTYSFGSGICSYYISPYLSTCGINWGSSNTCGIKYVLNTFLALKFQSVSNEYSKTQPIVKNDIEYKASFDYPSYRGHLRMIKVPTSTSGTSINVWDAGTAMPPAGTSGFPSAPLASTDTVSPRYLFTNLNNSDGSITNVVLDPVSVAALPSATKTALENKLGTSGDNTTVLINSVRGRVKASVADVYGSTSSCSGSADGTVDLYGCGEDSKRLWAIEKSTPALKNKSSLVESTETASLISGKDRRDRVVFAGADDGMLHAFWAGTYDATSNGYPDTNAGRGSGREIWAYIPSSLLGNLKIQPFNPDPATESTFEPKVAVDGSPKLADFLVKTSTSPDVWQWKTRLVSSASVRNENRGIIFSMDVTNPYDPLLKWESTYAYTDKGAFATATAYNVNDLVTYLSKTYWCKVGYTSAGDNPLTNTTNWVLVTGCSGTNKNCNMGKSAGVAIGSVQLGKEIKNYAFLTSSWVNKKKPTTSGTNPDGSAKWVVGKKDTSDPNDFGDYVTYEKTCQPSDTDSACVYGVSAYALDIDTGAVVWERSFPYTGTAGNMNDTPAVPALMDRDNNGSFDYVVFGDMQGRIWALRTSDGKNLTGPTVPAYRVRKAGIADTDLNPANYMDSAEPIGASVAVYRDYIVFGTGGADYASNTIDYRVEVVRLNSSGIFKAKDINGFDFTVVTGFDTATGQKCSSSTDLTCKTGEKIWAQPLITSDLKVIITTAVNYFAGNTVSSVQSVGRIIILDLQVARTLVDQTKNIQTVEPTSGHSFTGGFVGGVSQDGSRVYATTLQGSNNFQIGAGPPPINPVCASISKTCPATYVGAIKCPDSCPPIRTENPYRILWWRKM